MTNSDLGSSGGVDWDAALSDIGGGSTQTTNGAGGGTNWVTSLGQIVNTGAGVYRTATGNNKPKSNNNILLLAIGGVVALFVLVLALRK